jgi:hypothetical protein
MKLKSLLRKRKMENDAPLKPPEYRRNELGQFERPGATLGKAIKKVEKTKDEKFGNLPGPGPGRPKGSQAKVTIALKEAILQAGEEAGGEEGLVGYLKMLARDNSSAYAGLLAKILPSQIAADAESNGGRVEIRFVREIVHPGGHREIEGVTPKQIAPPASHMLPRSDEIEVEANDIK